MAACSLGAALKLLALAARTRGRHQPRLAAGAISPQVSLATAKGPPSCHEHGTTLGSTVSVGRHDLRRSDLAQDALLGFWRCRYDSPSMTSSWAELCSRSMADWARSGSAMAPSHSTGSRFEVATVDARRWRSTTSS